MKSQFKIHIINRNDPPPMIEGVGVYVGRGTPLGSPYGTNPYSPIKVDSRSEAIKEYEKYLRQKIKNRDPKIRGELNRIFRLAIRGDVTLICSCKPLACHGDVIKKIIEEKLK